MYASASGSRAPRRPRQRPRSQSDPGQSYVTPPYTVRWPASMRQATDPTGMGPVRPGTPYPFTPLHLPGRPTTPNGIGSSMASQLQRPGYQPSVPRHGSFRMPQGPSLLQDVPQPHSALSHVHPVVTGSAMPQPHPYPSSWGQAQGFPAPSHFQSTVMQRQVSQHNQQVQGVHQATPATHVSHHPSVHHQTSTSHHTHHRSRSRPPSAASHRYVSNTTQPVYGHGGSASSHTSLNGGPLQRTHRPSTPPPGMPSVQHPGTGFVRASSVSPHRSPSRTHVPHGSSETTATAHWTHTLEKQSHVQNIPSPPLAAREFRRTQRPALPANYDGQTQTRYVNMLLALDGISPLFNVLAAFFTWILLAGFLLFPGTFASWQDEPAGSPQSDILGVVNHVPLYVIAWLCTGIGASGMIWLWWKWYNNYIWLSNRIFIPGCLNSIAGIISTLSSIYGAQAGVFGKTETSTIIVTSVLSLICGILVLVYELWLIRNLRLEHDRIVGVEYAGKHGAGVLGGRRRGRRNT